LHGRTRGHALHDTIGCVSAGSLGARFIAGNLLRSLPDDRDPARRWTCRADGSQGARGVAAAQPRPRAGADRAPHVEHVGLGGAALQTFFVSLWPDWATLLGSSMPSWSLDLSTTPPTQVAFANTQWISFLLFWALNILIIYRGMDLLRRVERWAAPYVLVMTAILLGWAIWRAGGLGAILDQTSFDEHNPGHLTLAQAFVPALTGTIAFWSTLSLNMPDFTRFGRSQREQMIGQTIALPSTMTVFAAMAIMI